VDTVSQALVLTLLGMGWVFLFLGILVVFMSLMSVLARFLPKDEETAAPSAAHSASGSTETEIVAAIAAAQAHHKIL
jgi:sodium pump decarboxylase gamma subunit